MWKTDVRSRAYVSTDIFRIYLEFILQMATQTRNTFAMLSAHKNLS